MDTGIPHRGQTDNGSGPLPLCPFVQSQRRAIISSVLEGTRDEGLARRAELFVGWLLLPSSFIPLSSSYTPSFLFSRQKRYLADSFVRISATFPTRPLIGKCVHLTVFLSRDQTG